MTVRTNVAPQKDDLVQCRRAAFAYLGSAFVAFECVTVHAKEFIASQTRKDATGTASVTLAFKASIYKMFCIQTDKALNGDIAAFTGNDITARLTYGAGSPIAMVNVRCVAHVFPTVGMFASTTIVMLLVLTV